MDTSDTDEDRDTDSQGLSSHSSNEADPSLENASKRNRPQETTPEKTYTDPKKHSLTSNQRKSKIQHPPSQ